MRVERTVEHQGVPGSLHPSINACVICYQCTGVVTEEVYTGSLHFPDLLWTKELDSICAHYTTTQLQQHHTYVLLTALPLAP